MFGIALLGRYRALLGSLLGRYRALFGALLGRYRAILGSLLGRYRALLGVYRAHLNEIHLGTPRELQRSYMSVRHSSFG